MEPPHQSDLVYIRLSDTVCEAQQLNMWCVDGSSSTLPSISPRTQMRGFDRPHVARLWFGLEIFASQERGIVPPFYTCIAFQCGLRCGLSTYAQELHCASPSFWPHCPLGLVAPTLTLYPWSCPLAISPSQPYPALAMLPLAILPSHAPIGHAPSLAIPHLVMPPLGHAP